jgi:hypothetical protein
MGMWHKLSQNTKDDSQIEKHLTGECFHMCCYLQERNEFGNPTAKHSKQQTTDEK